MNVVIATPRRDLKRDAILLIAQQVFLEEGYAATSMSSIAARLGGSKGTLYNYFRSKAELFVAVIQEQCEVHQNQMFDFAEPDIRKFLTELARNPNKPSIDVVGHVAQPNRSLFVRDGRVLTVADTYNIIEAALR